MSKLKFTMLLVLVIGAAGISIWVGYLALQASAFDGSVFRALVPLLLLGSIALRLLLKARSEK